MTEEPDDMDLGGDSDTPVPTEKRKTETANSAPAVVPKPAPPPPIFEPTQNMEQDEQEDTTMEVETKVPLRMDGGPFPMEEEPQSDLLSALGELSGPPTAPVVSERDPMIQDPPPPDQQEKQPPRTRRFRAESPKKEDESGGPPASGSPASGSPASGPPPSDKNKPEAGKDQGVSKNRANNAMHPDRMARGRNRRSGSRDRRRSRDRRSPRGRDDRRDRRSDQRDDRGFRGRRDDRGFDRRGNRDDRPRYGRDRDNGYYDQNRGRGRGGFRGGFGPRGRGGFGSRGRGGFGPRGRDGPPGQGGFGPPPRGRGGFGGARDPPWRRPPQGFGHGPPHGGAPHGGPPHGGAPHGGPPHGGPPRGGPHGRGPPPPPPMRAGHGGPPPMGHRRGGHGGPPMGHGPPVQPPPPPPPGNGRVNQLTQFPPAGAYVPPPHSIGTATALPSYPVAYPPQVQQPIQQQQYQTAQTSFPTQQVQPPIYPQVQQPAMMQPVQQPQTQKKQPPPQKQQPPPQQQTQPAPAQPQQQQQTQQQPRPQQNFQMTNNIAAPATQTTQTASKQQSTFAQLLAKSGDGAQGKNLLHLFDGEWRNKQGQSIDVRGPMVNQRPIFTVDNSTTVIMEMDGIKYNGTVSKNGKLIQWSDGDEWMREGVPEPVSGNPTARVQGSTPPDFQPESTSPKRSATPPKQVTLPRMSSSPHVSVQIETTPADASKAATMGETIGETPPISGDEEEKTLKKNKLKKKTGKKLTDGEAKKEIAVKIKKWLREQDEHHKINRDDFKTIAKKCTEKMWKIYQTKRKQKAGLMPKDFLSKRRSGKIIALINKYIDQSKKRNS